MFCSHCGKELKEGSKFCGNCGTPVSVRAPQPAETTEVLGQDDFELIQVNSSPETDVAPQNDDVAPIDITETITTTATSVQEQVSDAVQTAKEAVASSGVQESITGALHSLQDAVNTVTNTSKTQTTPKPVDTTKRSNRQDYLASNELWTWLKKDERRQLFFTEGRELLSEDEYMDLVSQQLVKNEVPATIGRKTIAWDNSSVKTESYFVTPSSTAVNPLSCLLQFSNVGRFSFVEQKTFLAPPNLPPYPGKKKTFANEQRAKLFIYGVFCLLIGILLPMILGRHGGSFAAMLLVMGGILIAFSWPAVQEAKQIKEYNDLCDQQEAAYNQAWKDWEDTVFLHSFQESTNGKISRIYQAVFESIRQVNAEQFKDIESTDERVDTSMAELRQQISSLKESYR